MKPCSFEHRFLPKLPRRRVDFERLNAVRNGPEKQTVDVFAMKAGGCFCGKPIGHSNPHPREVKIQTTDGKWYWCTTMRAASANGWGTSTQLGPLLWNSYMALVCTCCGEGAVKQSAGNNHVSGGLDAKLR